MMSKEKLFKTYEKELKEFEDWIMEHPRLPKNMNKLLLLRFLKVYDFDIEAAKKLLIVFLETRKKHPHIFLNRDCDSEELKTATELFQLIGLKKTTGDNHKVTVFRLAEPDPSKFSYLGLVRLITAMLDSRFIYCDQNELINGEISIVDTSNFSFRHFTKILSQIGTMKAYMVYSQEAAPIKIIQSHFIQCPPIMSKMMALMKPFIRAEVWETMKIHSTLESLHECIPKDILPVEYGGTEGSLEELNQEVLAYFETCRDYLVNDDNWKIED